MLAAVVAATASSAVATARVLFARLYDGVRYRHHLAPPTPPQPSPPLHSKFDTFEELQCLWPEHSFVFVGDNGQGDVRAAEMIVGLAGAGAGAGAGRPALEAAYIHRVVPAGRTFGEGDPPSWRRHGIVLVDTFVDAAAHAATTPAHLGNRDPGAGRPLVCLVSPAGLRRVCVDAVRDFCRLDGPAPAGWEAPGGGGGGGLAEPAGPERGGRPVKKGRASGAWAALRGRGPATRERCRSGSCFRLNGARAATCLPVPSATLPSYTVPPCPKRVCARPSGA